VRLRPEGTARAARCAKAQTDFIRAGGGTNTGTNSSTGTGTGTGTRTRTRTGIGIGIGATRIRDLSDALKA
jgi:hypothetical protein